MIVGEVHLVLLPFQELSPHKLRELAVQGRKRVW